MSANSGNAADETSAATGGEGGGEKKAEAGGQKAESGGLDETKLHSVIREMFEEEYRSFRKKLNKEAARARVEGREESGEKVPEKKAAETAGMSRDEVFAMLGQERELGRLMARFSDDELDELEEELEGASTPERLRALRIALRHKKSSTETDDKTTTRGKVETPPQRRSARTEGAGERGGVPRPKSKKEYNALTSEQRQQLERDYPDLDPSELPTR